MIYLAKEYQKLIEQAQESIYGTKQIILPMPQCVVFYNGERMMADEETLRLSDSFMRRDQGVEADVELKVRMLNINYGHNKELLTGAGFCGNMPCLWTLQESALPKGRSRRRRSRMLFRNVSSGIS